MAHEIAKSASDTSHHNCIDSTACAIEKSQNIRPRAITTTIAAATAAPHSYLSEGPADLPEVVLRDVLVQVADVQFETRQGRRVAEDNVSSSGVLRLLLLSYNST